MMFAADQIGVKYGTYAADYQVLAEAQVRTAERFDFDYVSVISDPAREAADCGAQIVTFEDQPPTPDEANALLADKTTLAKMRRPDPLGGGRMHDRVRGVGLLRKKVDDDRIVEGWVEGPCAEAADLRGINTIMLDFLDDPKFVEDLFAFIIEMELSFALAQVDAGADMIGIGDAAASLVGPEIYDEFVWPHEKKLVDGIHAMGASVRLHICGNTTSILKGMGRLDCDIVDLDSLSEVAEGRAAMGAQQVLLGNIDPVRMLRNGTPQEIRTALADCHDAAGDCYIVSAGCEVPRDTPEQNILAMCDFARSTR
jgi:MtaA/CmuA family methyltransferase